MEIVDLVKIVDFLTVLMAEIVVMTLVQVMTDNTRKDKDMITEIVEIEDTETEVDITNPEEKNHVTTGKTTKAAVMVTNVVSHMEVMVVTIIPMKEMVEVIEDMEEEEMVEVVVVIVEITIITTEVVMVVINKEPEESATNLKKTVNVLTVIDVDSHMVKLITDKADQREYASNSKKEIVLMEINVDFLMKIKSKMNKKKKMINNKITKK